MRVTGVVNSSHRQGLRIHHARGAARRVVHATALEAAGIASAQTKAIGSGFVLEDDRPAAVSSRPAAEGLNCRE